jgi:phosphotransferase system IIB component
LQSVYEELISYAKSEDEKKLIEEEFKRYKRNYVEREKDILAKRSRLLSWNIAGRANFPVRQQEKREASYRKAVEESLEWDERAKKAILKKLKEYQKQKEIEEAGGEVNYYLKKAEELQKELERMKEVNKIIRKKKLSDEEKVKILVKEYGLSENEAIERAITGDYLKRKGYRDFELSSIRNKIKRLKEKAKKTEIKSEKSGIETIIEKEGVKGIINWDADRIQIVFDEKPSEEIRAKLKKHGFKWSPKYKAWQRKITDNSKYWTKKIIESM